MAEDSISDSIDRYHLSVTYLLFIKHPETVTLLQGKEIHGPGIDIGQTNYKKRRDIRLTHIHPEGAADGHIRISLFYGHRLLINPCIIWGCTFEDYAAGTVAVVNQVEEIPTSGFALLGMTYCGIICTIGLTYTKGADIKD